MEISRAPCTTTAIEARTCKILRGLSGRCDSALCSVASTWSFEKMHAGTQVNRAGGRQTRLSFRPAHPKPHLQKGRGHRCTCLCLHGQVGALVWVMLPPKVGLVPVREGVQRCRDNAGPMRQATSPCHVGWRNGCIPTTTSNVRPPVPPRSHAHPIDTRTIADCLSDVF